MIKCKHCNNLCKEEIISQNNLHFCCVGCKTVYEILFENNLNEYYNFDDKPNIKIKHTSSYEYDFLDEPSIAKSFIDFEDENIIKTKFHLPQIHCSSCIWLLENLNRLNQNIIDAQVNYSHKNIDITFKKKHLSIRDVIELLAKIGYKPDLSYNHQLKKSNKTDYNIYIKLGIAGFCFGNIMLLSFPEYLGIDESFNEFKYFFNYLNFGLSIPVIFYAGSDYLKSAYSGIKQKHMNMDIPISLGMITLFLRSSYEIFSNTGAGYLDSLAGLIFFLLIGKWFQQKTYESLSFDRDFKSYFPIAVNKIKDNKNIPTKLENIKINDYLLLRNEELIPADAILISDSAYIDYSFVTGESKLTKVSKNDKLYAGGKHVGTNIEILITKEVNNSYLTQLWNQKIFQKKQTKNFNSISNKISKYFTIIILVISCITAIYWSITDLSKVWQTVAAVLIVACPCALALSIPFTLGNMTRIYGAKGFYLKNANVIEDLGNTTDVIFDKTGTITTKESINIEFVGENLNNIEKNIIYSSTLNSLHPLSISISKHLKRAKKSPLLHFKEIKGKGIVSSLADGTKLKLGSSNFILFNQKDIEQLQTKVHIEINSIYKGYFTFEQEYRPELKNIITELQKNYKVHLLSGDNKCQESYIKNELNIKKSFFNQNPIDKLKYIENLQQDGKKVVMIGDGLNDAGALKQSDIGIALSESIHQFSPACDGILTSDKFGLFNNILNYSKTGIKIIKISFVISFLYNILGLSFAVSSNLSPIVAAILMPISSITIVIFTSISSNLIANKLI